MIEALVLAGSRNEGELRYCSSASYEALIPLGAKYMVEYVVDALSAANSIGKIVIVGPGKELADRYDFNNIQVVNPEGDMVQNALTGLKYLESSTRILVVTADIPLITPGAVDDFVSLCGDQQADLYYPVIPREVINNYFGVNKRTYVNLKDGVFTGGNIFLLNPVMVSQCISKGEKLINARKSPLKLCRLVGFIFLIKYLMKIVTLHSATRKASSLLEINGKAVISMYPQLGIDVDKPGDYDLVSKNLKIAR
ncbi:MAG: nucleotidyltransferase family protein [Clostridiales bacterium]|nr:nucleotidyltransferase family protein [Clostridiales bacterium]MCF8021563.1 nucleotidyltransferase family protein [Clostridiales bacterium]